MGEEVCLSRMSLVFALVMCRPGRPAEVRLIRLERSSRRRIEERAAVRRRRRRHGRPLEVARPPRACPVPQRQERVSRARGFLGASSPRFHRACLAPAKDTGWCARPAEVKRGAGPAVGPSPFQMPTSRGPHAFFTFAAGDLSALSPTQWAATAVVEKIAQVG